MVDAPSLAETIATTEGGRRRCLHVVGAAILGRADFQPGRCLAARRAAHVVSPLLWEFPGGKVEDGETPRQALEREVAEELGLKIIAGDFLGRGEAPLADGRVVVLDVYLAELVGAMPPPRLTDHDEVRWLSAAELDQLAWATADLPILPALAVRLSGSAPRC